MRKHGLAQRMQDQMDSVLDALIEADRIGRPLNPQTLQPLDTGQTAVLSKVAYGSLNSRQQENLNFHKISALLAEYGFSSIRLSDDWQGADFIAQHIDGDTYLKVQLKGRCTIDRKYIGKSLFIAFPYRDSWFLYSHDELLRHLLATTNIGNTKSWKSKGMYSFNSISRELLGHLVRYRL